jgi:hypothetical protein
MNAPSESWILFAPARGKGLLLYGGAMAVLAILIVILLISALSQQPGLAVILLLLGAFFLSLPLPFLLYRLYALMRSGYWVGRNGLRLRWGLRFIDLPFSEVVDIAGGEELDAPLPLPRWASPGGVIGKYADKDLGEVEFLASDQSALILLGTRNGVLAISPRDGQEFIAVFKRESERGSLRPIRSQSISPTFVLVDAWAQPRVPALLISGGLLALGFLILVGVVAPGLQAVTFGFGGEGEALQPVAGVQLFLLPALNLFFYAGNFFLGLVFFREPQGLRVSYLLWGSSLVSSFLFLVALLFIL